MITTIRTMGREAAFLTHHSSAYASMNTRRIAPQPTIQFRFSSSQQERVAFHFPDKVTMTQYLSNHPLLNINYFEKKGITKAIANLAAARFAGRAKVEIDIKTGTKRLISDLLIGKDGFTGEELPDLGKLGLPPLLWKQISNATEEVLMECATIPPSKTTL